jgi:hypothetical protein
MLCLQHRQPASGEQRMMGLGGMGSVTTTEIEKRKFLDSFDFKARASEASGSGNQEKGVKNESI